MVKFQTGKYIFYVHVGSEPEAFRGWLDRPAFSDVVGLQHPGTSVYIGIDEMDRAGTGVIAFNTDLLDTSFFHPELLFLQVTNTLFVGAGSKAMTYSLKNKVKLSDRNPYAFWYWAKHDNFIVMNAELEIAVYDYEGHFIWAAPAEPPWTYGIDGNTLILDIMGEIRKYEFATGKMVP
jgi:hypothetical protein